MGGEEAAEEAPKASPHGGFAALSPANGEPDEEEKEDEDSAEPNGQGGAAQKVCSAL